jgi:predicted NAD-dependent protein-ADP-ribosyltransferase YbiA (DUF1768 family)
MGPIEINGKFVRILDNFTKVKFVLDGLDWSSSEQAYQASKFEDVDTLQYTSIYLSEDPYDAYYKGQSRNHPIRSDFSICRKDMMYRCNMAKIVQNKEIATLLASSTGKIHFPVGDEYWKTILPEIMEFIRGKLNFGVIQITPHKTKKSQFVPLKVRVPKTDPRLTKIYRISEQNELGKEIEIREFLEKCLYGYEGQHLLCKPHDLSKYLDIYIKRFINQYLFQNLKGMFSVDGLFLRVEFEGIELSYSLSDF